MTHLGSTPRQIVFVICSFALMAPYAILASADKKDANAATAAVQDAAKKGFPLACGSSDPTGRIFVQAALIPFSIAKTVFGKDVAKDYAVIALTITNGSPDDSFIVHSIFVDYHLWLLSGGSPRLPQKEGTCSEQSTDSTVVAGQQQAEPGQPPSYTCGQTQPSQIDSVETRIVRGELLDRQPWTTRNWVLRALQAVGSIAAGFTFATTNQDWIRGIGAYNAHGIPAGQSFWPDATVGQMNRISDFGFQVNKVVPKQSSDIVVAFFPIDRFLTPDLKSVFFSSPAAFFFPLGALADPTTRDKLTPYIDFVFGPPDMDDPKKPATGETPTKYSALENLKAHLYDVVATDACFRIRTHSGATTQFGPGSTQAVAAGAQAAPTTTQPPPAGTQPTPSSTQALPSDTLLKACETAELVDRLSLNVVRVIVSGTMNVDVNKVPAQITEVQIDQDKDGTATWKKDSKLTGVIYGSFLGGGAPAVTNVDTKAADIQADSHSSTDTQLHFTITLKEDLPTTTTKLTFEVSKKSDGATIKSAAHDYAILTAQQAASTTGAAPGTTTTEAKPQPAPAGPTTEPAPPEPAPPKKH